MSSFFIYHTHDNFNIADPAVRRTHVIHKPCTWPSSPQVLRSSVVRASDHCMEDHRFNSCWGLRFFLCPMLVICWSHFSFLKLNYLSFYCANNVSQTFPLTLALLIILRAYSLFVFLQKNENNTVRVQKNWNQGRKQY